ncbi:MAG: VTT domain-containing protein [Anaerolineales bacterium]|nr:VTT domain-containing protein [Anaerolineales bacterium]MCK5634990.1 VTT domain-containing protein [Anaerolineales bacterium]
MKQSGWLSGWKLHAVRLLAFLVAIAITIFIFSIRGKVEQLAGFGYPSIFLLSLLANATIIIPAPAIALSFAFGAVFNPLGVALAAGIGAAIGEITGYLIGFSGQGVVDDIQIYKKLETWTARRGALVILILAFIPNPFFDLAGVAAGALKMPIGSFLLWTWLGKTLKMLIFAFAGAASIDWIMRLFPAPNY